MSGTAPVTADDEHSDTGAPLHTGAAPALEALHRAMRIASRRTIRSSRISIRRCYGNATINGRGCHRNGRRCPSATGANRMRLRLELRADLAALVCGAVHVDVQIAGLECRVLLVVQLRALGHAPAAVRA